MVLYGLVCCAIVVQPAQTDLSGLLTGFQDLINSSKFASVATVDFLILNVVSAYFVTKDYALRTSDDDENKKKATLIALSTLLILPFGSSLYCLFRPKLED
mmetsp:Transcript_15838/g.26821  ORF Transcript_15838/g.26821 Transcript_15838/m.26821 type:complete len:101 (-) Transcript_15838:30-332(-)